MLEHRLSGRGSITGVEPPPEGDGDLERRLGGRLGQGDAGLGCERDAEGGLDIDDLSVAPRSWIGKACSYRVDTGLNRVAEVVQPAHEQFAHVRPPADLAPGAGDLDDQHEHRAGCGFACGPSLSHYGLHVV